jgi:hypothetical protein
MLRPEVGQQVEFLIQLHQYGRALTIVTCDSHSLQRCIKAPLHRVLSDLLIIFLASRHLGGPDG